MTFLRPDTSAEERDERLQEKGSAVVIFHGCSFLAASKIGAVFQILPYANLRHIMKFPVLSTFLLVLSGVCWMIVYIEAIRIGLRDRRCAIPFWALALNLAWELLHTYYTFRLEGASVQAVINVLWAIFDVIVLYTWFRFDDRRIPGTLSTGWFIAWSLLVIAVAFALQYGFVIEFGIYPGRAYAAFLQNLLMSVLFIDMLVRRGSGEGQSMVIATGKWIGTLAPTLLFGVLGTDAFNGTDRLILLIGSLCSLFDLIYIALLARVKSVEKRTERVNSRL